MPPEYLSPFAQQFAQGVGASGMPSPTQMPQEDQSLQSFASPDTSFLRSMSSETSPSYRKRELTEENFQSTAVCSPQPLKEAAGRSFAPRFCSSDLGCAADSCAAHREHRGRLLQVRAQLRRHHHRRLRPRGRQQLPLPRTQRRVRSSRRSSCPFRVPLVEPSRSVTSTALADSLSLLIGAERFSASSVRATTSGHRCGLPSAGQTLISFPCTFRRR